MLADQQPARQPRAGRGPRCAHWAGMPSTLLSFFSGASPAARRRNDRPGANVRRRYSSAANADTLDQALSQVRNLTGRSSAAGGSASATRPGLALRSTLRGHRARAKPSARRRSLTRSGRSCSSSTTPKSTRCGRARPRASAKAFLRTAVEQDAVLLFDEADAIAARRFGRTSHSAAQREANTTVNVLLRELENFNGVVIFATNLAANFDPAFERRIHLTSMPSSRCQASRSANVSGKCSCIRRKRRSPTT